MSGNGRLLTPGQVNVATTYADGPLAQPSNVAMQGPGGMQILVMGGLTKVEALAGQIAATIAAQKPSDSKCELCEDIAHVAADIAESVLAECARRRTEAAKETP